MSSDWLTPLDLLAKLLNLPGMSQAVLIIFWSLLDRVTQNMEPPLPKLKHYRILNVFAHASNAMSKWPEKNLSSTLKLHWASESSNWLKVNSFKSPCIAPTLLIILKPNKVLKAKLLLFLVIEPSFTWISQRNSKFSKFKPRRWESLVQKHTYFNKSARRQCFVNKYEIFWLLHHLTTISSCLGCTFCRN